MPIVDGSIEEYMDVARSRGVEIRELEGTYSRLYEAASLISKFDGKSTIMFHVREYSYPFIANTIYSRKTLYSLLGVEDDREAYTLVTGAEKAENTMIMGGEFNSYFERIGEGIEHLPALKYYERDGGLYLTSSIIIACLQDVCNASVHRIMVAEDYAAVRVVPRQLYSLLERAGGSLRVAVVVGVDPRILLASSMNPPLGVFEIELAPTLIGSPLRLCKTPLYGLPVPCGSSMVIEGRLGPERRREGPFTDLLRLYDTVREEPVLHVESVYINRVYEPFIHAILPGGIEHMLLMGFPREAAIYNAVSRVVPNVLKVRLTQGSGMWLHAVISIRKLHEGDAKNAAFAAFAAHPSLKGVVVVDDDIDPDDMLQVEWAIATRLQAGRGLAVIPYARGSSLDPSARGGVTDKVVIDATAPLEERDKYTRPVIPHRRG